MAINLTLCPSSHLSLQERSGFPQLVLSREKPQELIFFQTMVLICLVAVLGLKFETAHGLNVAVKRETHDKEMLLAFVVSTDLYKIPKAQFSWS